jgi:competence protein ComEA
MNRRHALLVAAALVWVVAAHTSTISVRAQRRGGLPAGEGRETVVRVCGDCHEAEQMANSYRSRVEWEMLIEDMINRGGNATDEDKKMVVAYALRNFGKVNVNTAAPEDIAQIVDLPAAQAAAIVDYRQKSGEFKTLEDLHKVPDVDFGKIQERKDRIGFSGP